MATKILPKSLPGNSKKTTKPSQAPDTREASFESRVSLASSLIADNIAWLRKLDELTEIIERVEENAYPIGGALGTLIVAIANDLERINRGLLDAKGGAE